MGKPVARVFVRPAWRLHDTIESDELDNRDLHLTSVSTKKEEGRAQESPAFVVRVDRPYSSSI
jgi:hypothetical protein